MKYPSGWVLPKSSAEDIEDTLFHYTTASGVIGIIKKNELWCTSAYCSNDDSELSAGEGILSHHFTEILYELIKNKDRRMEIFYGRGVNPMQYAKGFEDLLFGFIFSNINAYISCFCKPNSREDLYDGLLSQWRGYGIDGGYAIQLSKKKIVEEIERSNSQSEYMINIDEVCYSLENRFRDKLLDNITYFKTAFLNHLTELAGSISSADNKSINIMKDVSGEAIESLLSYLIYTKNSHFKEERECRLSLIGLKTVESGGAADDFFSRNGLVVPFKKTPKEHFDIRSCINSILVGPSSRISARTQSVTDLVQSENLKIPVRPSRIPYVRD